MICWKMLIQKFYRRKRTSIVIYFSQFVGCFYLASNNEKLIFHSIKTWLFCQNKSLVKTFQIIANIKDKDRLFKKFFSPIDMYEDNSNFMVGK